MRTGLDSHSPQQHGKKEDMQKLIWWPVRGGPSHKLPAIKMPTFELLEWHRSCIGTLQPPRRSQPRTISLAWDGSRIGGFDALWLA
eukprot:1799441-Lingulodinium_polyedra.AAC.1